MDEFTEGLRTLSRMKSDRPWRDGEFEISGSGGWEEHWDGATHWRYAPERMCLLRTCAETGIESGIRLGSKWGLCLERRNEGFVDVMNE